jgi:hypothetical protein
MSSDAWHVNRLLNVCVSVDAPAGQLPNFGGVELACRHRQLHQQIWGLQALEPPVWRGVPLQTTAAVTGRGCASPVDAGRIVFGSWATPAHVGVESQAELA